MNRVPLARRVQIINCLVEGNSIRSTERMTGTHRDTICRLLVEYEPMVDAFFAQPQTSVSEAGSRQQMLKRGSFAPSSGSCRQHSVMAI